MTASPDKPQILALSEPLTSEILSEHGSVDSLSPITSDSQEESPITLSSTELTSTVSKESLHSQIEKDERHYYEFLELLVEDCLFQVPKYPFDEKRSSFWKSLEPVIYHGNAIRLQGIQKADFRALLDLLFPDSIGEKKSETLDDWKSILGLTHRWGMRKLFEEAMKALQSAPLHDQVMLARKYGVYDWLKSTYIQLAGRTRFLSEDEATPLGLEAVLKIARIREKRERGSSSWPAALATTSMTVETTDDFKKAITAELRELERLDKAGVSPTVVEQVMIGRKYAVAHLVNYGYQILTDRKESISLDEGKVLGLEITRDLCHAREMARSKRFGSYGNGDGVNIDVEVTRQFEEELNRLEKINEYYGKGPPAPPLPEKLPEEKVVNKKILKKKGKK